MGFYAVEISAAVVVALGFLFTCIAVGMPYWEQNDPEDTVNDHNIRHRGLWVKCTTYNTGNWQCDDFNRFFIGLPPMLQAARGFGVTAILLGLLASALLILGMDSIPCGIGNESGKKRIRLVSGILSILGGLCIIVAASWYANNLRINYDQVTMQRAGGYGNGDRNVFGSALFVGWAGGVLLVIGGLIATCTGCGDNDEDDGGQRPYIYKPPNTQQYV